MVENRKNTDKIAIQSFPVLRTRERVAQYYSLYSWLLSTIVPGFYAKVSFFLAQERQICRERLGEILGEKIWAICDSMNRFVSALGLHSYGTRVLPTARTSFRRSSVLVRVPKSNPRPSQTNVPCTLSWSVSRRLPHFVQFIG